MDLVATFVVAKTGLKPNSRASMFTARLKGSQILYGSDAVVLLPSEP
jgi:CRISPR/Cas system-associated protein Csm6